MNLLRIGTVVCGMALMPSMVVPVAEADIPDYRLKAADETVVTVLRRPAGQPEILRAWFYPGRPWGEEFVYPKAKAIATAKATNVLALFTPAEIPIAIAEPVKSPHKPVVVELKQAPNMAVQPSGHKVQVARVVPPTHAEEMPVAEANPLFFIGGLGLIAPYGVYVIRAAGRSFS